MLLPPPGFPCAGATGACASGPGTREIHTEVRSLKRVNPGGPLPISRPAVWYASATVQNPPSGASPSEGDTHSGPGTAPTTALPPSSSFALLVPAALPP